MEFVRIQHKIPIGEYDEKAIDRIVDMYSGKLLDVIFEDESVTLLILAPTTWKTLLINRILLPYRYI